MSWNGQGPSEANWQGAPQFPGSEVLYTTPDPATTATNPSIGIVDGNEIPLPLAYNSLAVGTLTATTINSVNINNTQNINTATINGNPVPTSAELWSLYPAVHNVTGLDTQQTLYVARQLYALNALVSISPSPPIYSNWKKNIASYTTINPANTLDPWTASAYTRPYDVGCTYNGVQYKTVANSTNQQPPNATYWRLAAWDSATSYSTFDFALFGGNWYQAGAPPPVAGTSPPGVGWVLQTNWVSYVPVAPDPAFDITNFKTISSTTSESSTMNTGTGNALTAVNIGGNNSNPSLSTIGGALYVGKDTTDISQTKPVVQVGNATVGGSTVTIFGDLTVSEDMTVTGDTELKKTTIEGDTTITSEGGALTVNGGTTLDGGALTHGTSITALGGTIRIDVLPAGIDLTSATTILMNSVLATEISGLAGAVLTSAAATSVSAGGALSLAGGSYIEYNTDQNYFINTSAGNDFTDIYVGNIHPADGGSAPLRINDGTGRGVQIDNGTTWNTENINVSNTAIINNLQVVEDVSATFVSIPESTTLPYDWEGGTTYDLNALVIYAPTSTLYFSLANGNQGNTPTSSPTFWLLANWNVATTYSIGQPTFAAATNSLWTSLQNSNLGNFPTIPPTWEVGTTYGNGNVVVYNALHYQSLQAANTGNLPNVVGSLWWVNIPIYWTPNTTPYNIGNTDTGLVFTPVVLGSTGITTLVKRLGDPNEELNVVVKNNQGVELSAQSVVVSPMYKDFDMGNQDITNVKDITAAGNITISASTGNSSLTASGTVNVDSVGGATLNSSTANVAISAQQGITITSTASSVILEAATGSNVELQSPLDMTTKNIIGANTITGTGALTLATVGATNLNLSPDTGGLIVAGKGVNLSGNNITGGNIITGTGALTLATVGATNLNLSPDTGGLIEANKGIDMNNNTIVGASTITGTTTLTLASTGNSNINISPAGTGQVIINKQVNFSNQTLFNMVLTNVGGVYGAPTGALVLVSQQATNPTIQVRGAIQMWLNSTTQAPGNSIAGLTTLTGQTTLGLATLSNGDLSLSPNGTGTIIANKTLNMNSNTITNANTITGATTLGLATLSNGDLSLSPNGTGTIVANKALNMNGNTIISCTSITNNIGSLTVGAGGASSILQLAAGVGGFVRVNKDLNLDTNNIVDVATITAYNDLTLATTSNYNINLSPAGTGTIIANKTLNMNTNAISGVTTLNGRNLFAYGNFYNTASQTLGAINTATRVVMDTSLNNNLITLDTTTNIGRLTFTNAGVYKVVWSGYLLHGSGSATNTFIWIRLNGTDVAGSGKKQRCDAGLNDITIGSSSVVSVTASQYIEFYWAADGTNVPLTAVAASAPYPATPSFSCSVCIVG